MQMDLDDSPTLLPTSAPKTGRRLPAAPRINTKHSSLPHRSCLEPARLSNPVSCAQEHSRMRTHQHLELRLRRHRSLDQRQFHVCNQRVVSPNSHLPAPFTGTRETELPVHQGPQCPGRPWGGAAEVCRRGGAGLLQVRSDQNNGQRPPSHLDLGVENSPTICPHSSPKVLEVVASKQRKPPHEEGREAQHPGVGRAGTPARREAGYQGGADRCRAAAVCRTPPPQHARPHSQIRSRSQFPVMDLETLIHPGTAHRQREKSGDAIPGETRHP